VGNLNKMYCLGMGHNMFDVRRGPGAIWPDQRPKYYDSVQGTRSHCHFSHLAHSLRFGKVRVNPKLFIAHRLMRLYFDSNK